MQAEQRQAARKVFKTRAMLAVEGAPPVLGRTTDISSNGVSISVPNPVAVGQDAQLRFDLLVEGSIVPVKVRARTQYCILSNGEFKAGFQFVNPDLNLTTALSRLLR